MTTVIARLQVDDFDTWYAEYQTMHTAREAAGECGRVLYREIERPNAVVVVFSWTSAEDARAYFGSDLLADSLDRARARRPELIYLMPASPVWEEQS